MIFGLKFGLGFVFILLVLIPGLLTGYIVVGSFAAFTTDKRLKKVPKHKAHEEITKEKRKNTPITLLYMQSPKEPIFLFARV